MARAIAQAGWPLHIWARHPRSLAVLADTPHTTHDSVPDLGRACDIVGLCMTDDSDVHEILEDGGLLASLPTNGIVVNHGTGDPQVAATLAQRVREQGHELLDAPVSGGRPAAERRTLTTFVGGDAGTVQRCRPVFEHHPDRLILERWVQLQEPVDHAARPKVRPAARPNGADADRRQHRENPDQALRHYRSSEG